MSSPCAKGSRTASSPPSARASSPRHAFDGEDEVLAGEVAEGHEFTEAAFNRLIQIKDRELHRVRTLLNEIKLNEKTIIFCPTQAQAASIRDLINQEVQPKDQNYCVRVTAEDALREKPTLNGSS